MSTFFLHNSEIYGYQIDPSWMSLNAQNVITFNPGGIVGTLTTTATGSTTPRTLADRAADRVNPKDFGAKIDGTTNDTTAWNNARTAAGDNGIVFVPKGGQVVSSNPTGGSANPVLWQYSGNSFGTGTTPVVSLGTDLVESFIGKGGKYIGRGATTADTGPVLRLDSTVNHTGGTSGFVIPTLKLNTTVPADGGLLNNYIWGISSVINTYSTGPGQNVAIYGQANKYSAPNAWAAVFDAQDHTGLASNAGGGPMVPVEVDLTASGADPNNIRVGVDTVLFNLSPGGVIAEAGVGYRVSGGTNTVAKSAFTATCAADVVYDASSALTRPAGTTYGLRMKQAQMIDFKGDGTRTLGWFTSGSLLQYAVSGTTFFSITEGPNLARFFTAFQAASMDSTPVGATTPSTGAFTTLSASGQATLASAKFSGSTFSISQPSSGAEFMRLNDSGGALASHFDLSYIAGSNSLTIQGAGAACNILIQGSGGGVVTLPGINVTGGSVNGATVGATTASTGKFTTLTATSALTLAAPLTVTGTTYTVLATDSTLILNPAAGQTLTLGTATAGRVLYLKLIAAFAVTSASSNVVPQAGGAAGTAILSATAGKWAMLQGDGTNWQVVMSN